ncbi:MAG: LUD domain-containing protein [Rhodospirillaceae bacterium]|jgi:L-lactate dehydrogenase complex protein LldG|nr:LUD domain-containing protein [Rhodospirillaceae bacterium]MBT5667161.1 LUD domain-containing protein [Rhodospirillaceae bacterium]MBT5809864.1 LUD domain-containing protein [Rhodospirillaceae bacterium]
MSDVRAQILGRLRQALDRTDDSAAQARLSARPRGIVPARTDRAATALIDLFVTQAESVDATVDRVEAAVDVPDAVAAYLAQRNLPSVLRLAPDSQLDDIPWDQRPTLSVTRGKTDGSHDVSVTGAFAGIAETGTLMLRSGPESPSTLNFLPDTHMVVLRASQIKKSYEDGWDEIRLQMETQPNSLPRTVNFITGPSRTGDIEQKILMGAHGPRRLHIVLIEDEVSLGEADDGV